MKSDVARVVPIAGVGILIGLSAAWAAYGPGRMPDSLPHLVAGWVAIVSGLVAWWRVRWSRIGPLLVTLGMTWYLGDYSTCLNIEPLAHRCLDVGPFGDLAAALGWVWLGVLVHVLLSFPDGLARTWPRRAGIASGYAIAIAIPALPELASALDRVTTTSNLGLAVSLVSITILAALLAADARRADLTTDRAVGLGDALAAALGDPTFRIAFKQPPQDAWVDSAGRSARAPQAREGLTTTTVQRDNEVLAVVEHDPATLADPQIRAAVTMAVELGAHNVRLRTDLGRQLTQVAASRRRLVDAGLEERRALAGRVDAEVEAPLQRLAIDLAALPVAADDPTMRTAIGRARDQLEVARAEMHDLASGLFPRILEGDGLTAALRDLESRSSMPVEVVASDRVTAGPEADATIYFVCAEALANAERHANASSVRISLSDRFITATIQDDGAGGADLAAGTGLQGLRDRVEALGGTLSIASGPPPGHGSRP